MVSDADREVLVRLSKRPTAPHGIATRARIVLLSCEGLSNTEVAKRVGVDQMTVRKWRGRYRAGGVDALSDEPRPGVPRTFGDEAIEALVVKTLTEKPRDATHWSTREMAKATGMSQPTVSRIWKAFGLKPWAVETFKLSEDPFFIEKVRDVVGLYMNPPEHAAVICVDEKNGIQALDRTQPTLPMRPGQVERRTHDYVRNGVTDLFAALDVATGQVISKTRRRHRAEVQGISRRDRPQRPRRPPSPSRARQPLRAQDADDSHLAAATPTLPAALHPHELELAQPRRALVRGTHPQTPAAIGPSQRATAREGPEGLGRDLERGPEAVRLAQDRRRDPRIARAILRNYL
jgi:transposase